MVNVISCYSNYDPWQACVEYGSLNEDLFLRSGVFWKPDLIDIKDGLEAKSKGLNYFDLTNKSL